MGIFLGVREVGEWQLRRGGYIGEDTGQRMDNLYRDVLQSICVRCWMSPGDAVETDSEQDTQQPHGLSKEVKLIISLSYLTSFTGVVPLQTNEIQIPWPDPQCTG